MSAPSRRRGSTCGVWRIGWCGCAAISRSATGRASRRTAPSRSKSQSGIDGIVDGARTYRKIRATGRRLAPVAALGFLLAGCSSSLLSVGAPPGSLPVPLKQAQQQQQQQAAGPDRREHQRILAAYGGAYEDDKLEAMVSQTVAKLVAASERPDVSYRVTILNSASVNAFALPSGELYVTRGLIALANDSSELASVLAHEMSHVIARHAAMREDEAR